MTEVKKAKSGYREMMAEVAAAPEKQRTPTNYFSKLSIKIGAMAGIAGSIAIISVITVLAFVSGQDVWQSPRVIASVLLGAGAWTGVFPIILGTVLHLIAGAIYGVIFAAIMPRMPRAFWFVAGIIFGMVIWVIAALTLPFVIDAGDVGSTAYITALIISHITFGIVLGAAGSFYGIAAKS